MNTLRAAVIGAGHLGRYHAQKYVALANVDLVAVVDINAMQAKRVASECAAQACLDHRELFGQIDLASVVVPTPDHYTVARDLLNAGVHVLVEKPFTENLGQAHELIGLVSHRDLVLQVGHVERFNPVMQALADLVDQPAFIECYRIAPFQHRGADVDVVLDLMIHDLDLVLKLVPAAVDTVSANGTAVVSSKIDVANARIQFSNGCVANLTASRVSQKSERSMRIFQHKAYLAADLAQQSLRVFRKRGALASVAARDIDCESFNYADQGADALMAEIRAFVDCVRFGQAPLVSGGDGLRALEVAQEVIEQVRQGQQRLHEFDLHSTAIPPPRKPEAFSYQ